jgi:hypothetical protein
MLEKEDIFLQRFGIGAIEDFVPGLRYVYKSDITKFLEEFTVEVFDLYFSKKLKEAEKTFDKGKMKYEPCHDKTNIMGLRPAWIQTCLLILNSATWTT